MVRTFASLMFLCLGNAAATADARVDSLGLLNAAIEASNNLTPAIEAWDGIASPAVEAMLRTTVLDPLEAARDVWFEAGMSAQGADANPYQQYWVCYDAVDQLRYQAIQLIRFHGGNLKAHFVTFEHVVPATEKMDECLAALKE